MADVDNKSRADAINSLLSTGKIGLFQTKERGLLYKATAAAAASAGGEDPASASSSRKSIRGDAEEKMVYKIVSEAGNKGTWIRDIRVKSNLGQTQLSKVIKTLKGKKLIKEVKCVNSARKIVYMLYELEPDRSVTGGAWYSSDKDFDSEFVDILTQQCHR